MYLGHHENGNNQLGAMGGAIKDMLKKLRLYQAQQAAAAEAERLRLAVAAEVAKLVPTAEETAAAFVEEIKTIAPTVPVEMPTVVTPPDSRLAPPPPLRMTIPPGEVPPRMVTTPVDSIPGAAFPLMQQYGQQVPVADESLISRFHAPPPEAPPPEEKKGVGVGTVLALGIPLVLAMAG